MDSPDLHRRFWKVKDAGHTIWIKKWTLLDFTASYDLSRLVGKPTMWFPKMSDTNRPVQSQKMARDWKFCI